jgi:putative solute:sodium symporter small subunit
MSSNEAKRRYWRANLRLVAACLVVWFIVSFGFGILLAGPLDRFSISGVKLGFWFAQQGSMFIFIGLIFFYAWRMNRLDREHDVDEE